MTTVEITLTLPEELVRDAREFNVLTDQVVASLLQAEVDRKVMDFVNDEIHDYRAAKVDKQHPSTSE